ncbi:hypothetical protein BGZ75_007700 [Mortierella antarctica]|nr:hypothetical protein BGZ75_007700 [Mortierella antarctica]
MLKETTYHRGGVMYSRFKRNLVKEASEELFNSFLTTFRVSSTFKFTFLGTHCQPKRAEFFKIEPMIFISVKGFDGLYRLIPRHVPIQVRDEIDELISRDSAVDVLVAVFEC